MAEIDDEVAAAPSAGVLGLGLGMRREETEARPAKAPTRLDAAYFEYERLDVFRYARDFYVLSAAWRKRLIPHKLKNQFDDSALSIVSNIAEGAGKTAKADKQRFYEMAKGSTTEAAAQLELIHLLGFVDAVEYTSGRQQLLRIAKMLSGLCAAPRTVER